MNNIPTTVDGNVSDLSAEHLSALELAAGLAATQDEMRPLIALPMGEAAFSTWVNNVYDLDESWLTDGVICYAGGADASEIAVLTLRHVEDTVSAQSKLNAYIRTRAVAFTGYAPEQAAIAEKGIALTSDNYVALLICPDASAAKQVFQNRSRTDWSVIDPEMIFIPFAAAPVSEESPGTVNETVHVPESTPEPNTDTDMENPSSPHSESESDDYDHDAVLAAWKNGDPSALSPKNRDIYELAAQVIAQEIDDSMDIYHKELAIHDYITHNAQYDPEELSHAPDAHPDPDNDNPYGILYKGVGICLGYMTTFQLFMDMLDIECISVPGSSDNLGEVEDHAWNMVRIDGEWYCVDTTWDDPVGGFPVHHYFNATTAYLKQNHHIWDESAYPQATAIKWAWAFDK